MIENVKKLALLLVVTIICVACDKTGDLPMGDPGELRIGLVKEIEIPTGIYKIYGNYIFARDKGDFMLTFNSVNYIPGTEKYKKIDQEFNIDNGEPYLIFMPHSGGFKLLGGSIRKISLRCNNDFNSDFASGSDMTSKLSLKYLDVYNLIANYNQLEWYSNKQGSGWVVQWPKSDTWVGTSPNEIILPEWEELYTFNIADEPSESGTYEFTITMKIYSPIYGEKTMEKEFSKTWE